MTLAAEIVTTNASKIGALLDVIIAKADKACFVDIIVGLALVMIYGCELYAHAHIDPYPLLVALAITRGGDTIKTAAKDFAYFWGHRDGDKT